MSAYHDLDSPQAMRVDAAAAGARLPRPAFTDPYTDLYAGFPTDLPKPRIEITEAAQRLANALELHLG